MNGRLYIKDYYEQLITQKKIKQNEKYFLH